MMSSPTPDDLRKIVLDDIQEIFAKLVPYIDYNLERRARTFFSSKEVVLDLKFMQGSVFNDTFKLEVELADYGAADKINRPMAIKLMQIVKDEYKKSGWKVVFNEESYKLFFSELEGGEKILVGDSNKSEETTRSELLDLE